jgi:TRAP-type C4-dicarboxylate transport system permease small subunit
MKKLLNIIEKIISIFQIVFLSAIVIVIGAQIVSRSAFNIPLEFSEELSMFILIAVVFLGVGIIEKHNGHIKVEFIYELISPKKQDILRLSSKILTLFIILAIINGERQLLPRVMKLKTTAAGIPYIWLHSVIVISCILWIFFLVFTMLQTLKDGKSRE